ncbi:MbcA/ParS/Xre antitoxin family protein [Chromobacterium violaceum]|uniref:MbcA/ParS/Xre antitoxin family protein n=1 Tax=Chromobacterium violaceum TaxID=536 RepID=UPI001CE20740|nr:MbcA/ParS/Xre antitoxin family protein [Chromobacterium violaceum]
MPKLVKLYDIPLAWRKTARELGVVYVQGKGWFCTEPVPEELLMFVPNEVTQKSGRQTNVGRACPKCGSHTILRESARGSFWGCATYPRCNGTVDLYAEEEKNYKPKNASAEKARAVGFTKAPNHVVYGSACPKCGSQMVLRDSPYGNFWGCMKFPQCKEKIKAKATDEEIVKLRQAIPKEPKVANSTESVLLLAKEIFGSKIKVSQWFLLPNSGLGGERPGNLLGTEEGCDRVMALLQEIDKTGKKRGY